MRHTTTPAVTSTDRAVPLRTDRRELLLVLLGLVALCGIVAWQLVPQVFQGELLDPDGYMRLLRVERLWEGGGWYDATSPRSNAPYGEELHWTRPLDVLILVLALPAMLFMNSGDAIFWASVVVAPLLFLATALAVAWGAAPLTGGRAAPIAMIAVAAQPGIMGFVLPGRPDHHALLVFLFALAVALQVRSFSAGLPAGRPASRNAFLAGLVSALGLWVSVEFLLPLAVFLVGHGLLWVAGGANRPRPQRAFAVGLFCGVAAALLLERGPGVMAEIEYDRLSMVHLAVATFPLVFWSGVVAMEGRASRSSVRLLPGLGAVLAAAILLQASFPLFFQGPWAEVDPQLRQLWLARVEELQPVLMPRDLEGLGRALAYMGQALVVGPLFLTTVLRRRDEPRSRVHLFLLPSLFVFAVMALVQVRWVVYAELVVVVGITEAVFLLRDRLRGTDLRSIALRVVGTAGLLVGFIFIGAVVLAWGQPAQVGESGGGSCDLEEGLRALEIVTAPGTQRTVAAHVDDGPEILYRTPHLVLATPYHRNAAGVLDTQVLLSGTSDRASRAVARRRNVQWILLCPGRNKAFFREGEEQPTLYGRLMSGSPPDWVRPVELSQPAGGYRLFEVVLE